MAEGGTRPTAMLEVSAMSDIELHNLDDGESPIRRSQMRFKRTINRKTRRSQIDSNGLSQLRVYEQENSEVTENMITDLKKKIKCFYVTPCEKWNSSPRKVPFKLVLQLLKVLVVTIQLSAFAAERTSFIAFDQGSKMSFCQVFLKDWEPESYAVYSQEDLFSNINYVAYQYFRFSKVTVNAFQTTPQESLQLGVKEYAKVHQDLNAEQNYSVDSHVGSHNYVNITNSIAENCTKKDSLECYDIQSYLEARNRTIHFHRLTELVVRFTISGINVKEPAYSFSQPVADVECVKFRIQIVYDNSRGNGQIPIKLKSLLDVAKCKGNSENNNLEESIDKSNMAAEVAITAFDVFVLLVCVTSFTLALRSTIQRCRRMVNATAIFEEHYGYTLTVPERTEFLSMWYIQYMFSDACVICGTALKIYLRFGVGNTTDTYDNDSYYNIVAMALGIASLAQWIGLIRYLVFFNRYYILILTLSNAVPALIRFLVCGAVIFFGFMFAGWVILGPYHPKFFTITNTAQALFGLVSGDDIYATMSLISQQEHPVIFAVSQAYFYIYIILFMFAIANLFIAVITDSYESVKNGTCFNKSFLQHFVDGTLVVVGKTSDQTQKVYDELTEADVDEQYGMLSPLLCCLDRCVHHEVNVNKPQGRGETTTNSS